MHKTAWLLDMVGSGKLYWVRKCEKGACVRSLGVCSWMDVCVHVCVWLKCVTASTEASWMSRVSNVRFWPMNISQQGDPSSSCSPRESRGKKQGWEKTRNEG